MRSDLDQMMEKDSIDALWVTGSLQNNPDMGYFTGIHHVSIADLIKKRSKEPILFLFTPMEREEGEKSGLETRLMDADRPLDKYLKEHSGNLTAALATRMKEVFIELGLANGRVAVSGKDYVNKTIALIGALKPLLPDTEFIGYFNNSLIDRASMTKAPDEAARIREMGKITVEVVFRTADFLTSCRVDGNQLIAASGKPLIVTDVKSRIRLWLAELGADNPEETIFSIGRDAGIPHSAGTPDDIIEMGKPIIFDIFPCEAGGGYFYDFTRTWCLGWAPDDVQKLHNQVLDTHHTIIDELKEGKPFKEYQSRTCQLFSEMGHATVAEDFNLVEGYNHSVGHGLGLRVHENPFSGITAGEEDILNRGVVFTIEPGLYYPSKGMGARIEDTIYLKPQGKFEILAEYPYDLVLPMKNR